MWVLFAFIQNSTCTPERRYLPGRCGESRQKETVKVSVVAVNLNPAEKGLNNPLGIQRVKKFDLLNKVFFLITNFIVRKSR